jgi:uncharacterized membrane protein YoaT (DUF817 family)
MNRRRRLWVELALELAAFSLLTVSVVLLWRSNALLLIVLLAEITAVMCLWHDRQDLSFFAIVAVLGSTVEVVFVHSGIWRYGNPSFLGVPPWFPIAFPAFALVGQRLARTIVDMWDDAVSPIK